MKELLINYTSWSGALFALHKVSLNPVPFIIVDSDWHPIGL